MKLEMLTMYQFYFVYFQEMEAIADEIAEKVKREQERAEKKKQVSRGVLRKQLEIIALHQGKKSEPEIKIKRKGGYF